MRDTEKHLKWIILAIVACLLWSTAFVGIKIGLRYATPLQFAGIRFFLAGLMIMPFCGNIFNYFQAVKRNYKRILIVGIMQTFILYAMLYTAINMIPGSLTAIVVGGSPLYVAIIAHAAMPDDKLSFNKIISIGLGLTGVIILSLSRFEDPVRGGIEFLGILLLITGNVSSGFAQVIISRYRANNLSPFIFNSAQIMFGGILLFIISIPIEGFQQQDYPVEFFLALFWLSFVSAAAFSIWFFLLRRPDVKLSELNIWKFLIPVSGAILSWSLLPDEKPEFWSILGMVFIAAGLILINIRLKRKNPSS